MFSLIRRAGIISTQLEKKMHAMAGFRKVALHEYQELDLDVLHHIARYGWEDLTEFCLTLGLNITPQPTNQPK